MDRYIIEYINKASVTQFMLISFNRRYRVDIYEVVLQQPLFGIWRQNKKGQYVLFKNGVKIFCLMDHGFVLVEGSDINLNKTHFTHDRGFFPWETKTGLFLWDPNIPFPWTRQNFDSIFLPIKGKTEKGRFFIVGNGDLLAAIEASRLYYKLPMDFFKPWSVDLGYEPVTKDLSSILKTKRLYFSMISAMDDSYTNAD